MRSDFERRSLGHRARRVVLMSARDPVSGFVIVSGLGYRVVIEYHFGLVYRALVGTDGVQATHKYDIDD